MLMSIDNLFTDANVRFVVIVLYNYYLTSLAAGECKNCSYLPGCKTCSSLASCDVCLDNFFKDPDDNVCKSC